MKKPGFPPSTIALVVLMLGALFMVSKTVTPPPAAPPPVTPASATTETPAPKADPGHGEPGHVHGDDEDHGAQKPDVAAAKPDPKKQQEEMKKFYQKKMAEEKKQREIAEKAQADVRARMKFKPESGTKPLKYDPSSNNIDSKFFTEMPMGDQGIEATDKAVAQAEVIKAKLRQAEAAKKAAQKSEQPKQATP